MQSTGQEVVRVAEREVVLHHGDPLNEYRQVRSAAGVAEREDRARIRLWGKDPARMLHGLITNDLLGAEAGRGVYGAMLTPKGRMIADLRAFRVGGEVLVELSREALAGVTAHLKKFVPPMFARWADASDEIRQIGVYGPRSRDVIAGALGMELPILEEDGFVEGGGPGIVIAGTREIGLEEGYDVFVPAADAEGVRDRLLAAATALGGGPVGLAALEMLRMEAGRPRFGAELTEEVIPTEAFEETGLMPRAISFTKGCYTGQEVIIRIAHRGHVNRHLRGLRLEAGDTPASGARLFSASGKDVGRITGATVSPLMGQTIGLGYLRREVQPGDHVNVGAADGPGATVVRLPFEPDAAA